MEEFSNSAYKVDILKVEFPDNAAFVEGSAVYKGRRAYTRGEALEFFSQADAAARTPYIYLSADVSIDNFINRFRLAAEATALSCPAVAAMVNCWQ